MKEKLGIKYQQVCKIFADRFVPKLMDLTLKDLRKAAEQDMGGMSASNNEGAGNIYNLKEVLKKTVKATKVARGTEGPKFDEAEQLLDENMAEQEQKKHIDEDDEEDDEASANMANDIDGHRKKVSTEYEAESQSEVESDVQSIQQAQTMDIEETKDTKKQKSDIESLKKFDREKHGKYLQFIKGEFEFENNSATIALQFPLEYKKLLLLTLAETAMGGVLVSAVKDIEKCTLIPGQNEKDRPYLLVQGINFEPFEKHPDVFDLESIQTNHSYALKTRYGIEACRLNIVKEIRGVFDAYGISVDYRHLSLIADFVTFNGDYRAFNRIGMEESSSPFLKMSYETTMKYLVQSSISRDTDWITSPSSALVLG